jgi:hypothetical protein
MCIGINAFVKDANDLEYVARTAVIDKVMLDRETHQVRTELDL